MIGGCTSFVLTTYSNFWRTKITCTIMQIIKLWSFTQLRKAFAAVSSFKGRHFWLENDAISTWKYCIILQKDIILIVKWYMKYFIYWTADLKSSKLTAMIIAYLIILLIINLIVSSSIISLNYIIIRFLVNYLVVCIKK